MLDASAIPVRATLWKPCFRLIPSRYPTVGLYDAIADPADLDVVFAIEALTNPRIRDEIGQLQLVPPDERVSGPGATPVMAAFTHLNPDGSRFSDGSYGVYYAAQTLGWFGSVSTPALASLERATHDESAAVRKSAAGAIAAITTTK